jgi:hypothetical protein
LVLDAGTDVGVAGEPVDRFADHHVEAAAGVFDFGEQIYQAAVAGDRDVHVLVGGATAAALQGGAAGLDVPEPGGDLPPVREGGLAVDQLSREGEGRVLLVVGGDPGEEPDSDANAVGFIPAGGVGEERGWLVTRKLLWSRRWRWLVVCR